MNPFTNLPLVDYSDSESDSDEFEDKEQPTSVPYLPTEMMEIIFDYKRTMEAKDRHQALTKALIVEYLDLPWDGVDSGYKGRRYFNRWALLFNEHFCWIDSNRNMKEGYRQCLGGCARYIHPDYGDCWCPGNGILLD